MTHVPTDAELTRAVDGALKWDPLVPNQRIQATVTAGWARLAGRVDNVFQRDHAEQAVRRVFGIRGVMNAVVVGSSGIEAAAVCKQIDEALAQWVAHVIDHIHVDVDPNSNVTLSGPVASRAFKVVALDAARRVQGVQGVADLLDVDPTADDPAPLPPALSSDVISSSLSEEARADLRTRLGAMPSPVRLLAFTETGCPSCESVRQLVKEIGSLSSEVKLEMLDPAANPQLVALYHIDKLPAIALVTGGVTIVDTGIRFYGCLQGDLITALVEAISIVAARDDGLELTPATHAWLSSLDQPLHLQVFVTPRCPGGLDAIALAQRLALASTFVRADALVATEFPQVAAEYHVASGPVTVIHESIRIQGLMPEDHLIDVLKLAVVGEPNRFDSDPFSRPA